MPEQPNDQPPIRLPVHSASSAYEDLIAARIIRKVWYIVSGVAVFVFAFLIWMGFDLTSKRNIISKDIKDIKETKDKLQKETKEELEKTIKELEKETKEELEKTIKELEKETERASDLANEMKNKLVILEQRDAELQGRSDYLKSLIENAGALPNEYMTIVATQSELLAGLTQRANNQLETSKVTLKQISSDYDTLSIERENIKLAIENLEQFKTKLGTELRTKLDERLLSLKDLEDKVYYRRDEVLWLRTEETVRFEDEDFELGIRLEKDRTVGNQHAIKVKWVRNEETELLLCDANLVLEPKKSLVISISDDKYLMTYLYLVEVPNNNLAAGLRFERLNDSSIRSCRIGNQVIPTPREAP